MDYDDPEVRKGVSVNSITHGSLNATDHLMLYFSAWRKIKVSVAWFLRLKKHLLELSHHKRRFKISEPQTDKQKGSILTPKDLLEAESSIICYCQQQRFVDEISSLLSEKRTVSKQSSIYKLDPTWKIDFLELEGD